MSIVVTGVNQSEMHYNKNNNKCVISYVVCMFTLVTQGPSNRPLNLSVSVELATGTDGNSNLSGRSTYGPVSEQANKRIKLVIRWLHPTGLLHFSFIAKIKRSSLIFLPGSVDLILLYNVNKRKVNHQKDTT